MCSHTTRLMPAASSEEKEKMNHPLTTSLLRGLCELTGGIQTPSQHTHHLCNQYPHALLAVFLSYHHQLREEIRTQRQPFRPFCFPPVLSQKQSLWWVLWLLDLLSGQVIHSPGGLTFTTFLVIDRKLGLD